MFFYFKDWASSYFVFLSKFSEFVVFNNILLCCRFLNIQHAASQELLDSSYIQSCYHMLAQRILQFLFLKIEMTAFCKRWTSKKEREIILAGTTSLSQAPTCYALSCDLSLGLALKNDCSHKKKRRRRRSYTHPRHVELRIHCVGSKKLPMYRIHIFVSEVVNVP